MAEFGKRELKKARTRQDILGATYRLTAAINFRDLKVRDIADEVGITEMTFFNHFPKKEDVLRYMMGIWALDLLAAQRTKPLSGEAAIRRIFQRTAQQVKQHPGMMVSFIASLAVRELETGAGDIEAADRHLLYPDQPELYEVSIPSGNELLVRHLVEANPGRDPGETLLHLASCFYGDVLVAHTAGLDLGKLYTKSLDLILGAQT